jgi:glycosyltransferase involved in cell wall biosynthesis
MSEQRGRGDAFAPHQPATPAVSVIVPSYNYAKTLRVCLASAFAQTYRAAEVIVVDDRSTDGSAEIAREFPCRLIVQPRNRGAAAARNTGAAAATGEILFFLDSDVALEPDAIGNAVRLLAEDPGCGCVYGIHPPEPLIDDGPVERYRTLHMHHALLRASGYTKTAIFALAAIPKAVFTDVGPFDENFRGAGGEDTEYSDRLAARYRILLSPSVVGRHDDEDRLLPLLSEQYRRGQLLRFQAGHRFRANTLKVNSLTGVVAAALSVGTLPLALLRPAALVLPAASVALFTIAHLRLSRLVLRERGPAFLAYFTGVHFLVNLAIVAGIGAGTVRAAVDPNFGPARRRRPLLPRLTRRAWRARRAVPGR